MSKFDLHFHSTYSDGKLSVSDLATIIKQEKLKYCALVDHNSVEGIQELKTCLSDSGITVISGTELTAKYDNENEIHILAYDFDINEVKEILKERNDLVRQQKIEEMQRAIRLTLKEGLEIRENLAPTEKQPATLTTALDICASRANQKMFLKKYGKELLPEDVYYQYQAPGKPCAVKRSGVTVEWLVEKFKNVAQNLIIAHPFVSVSVVTKPLDEPRIKDLLQRGITGIEAYHNKTSDEQILLLKKIIHERGIHYTGGSDFHGNKTDTTIGQYGHARAIPDFYLSRYSLNQKKVQKHV